ncbi:pyruvate kinase [Rhizobium sp. SG_E_25_P2]|uniref:pyruvate kinase n=1 Tax=Rhizobium sp. SG_E_25_P2 TaxID=2879942 RepID=UPI0024753EBE|nr:pyruvate kinase [Rhizobium sp. SG_E_25_P2]MDH6269862.1 pyruvate kinase [Rhizobium sp. SG_E_25_P2]
MDAQVDIAPKDIAPEDIENAALLDEIKAVRREAAEAAPGLIAAFGLDPAAAKPELFNLAAYLAIRHRDLRPLQRQLMARGLSSLGRMESRVLPTLDAVAHALAALSGGLTEHAAPSEEEFFSGEARLIEATDLLFGAPRSYRRGRIMVTMPSEAAGDADFVLALAKAGMDVARINCAHDGPDVWRAIADHVRAAAQSLGRDIPVLMDIAGPKIRVETVVSEKKAGKLAPGDLFRLTIDAPEIDGRARFAASVSLPDIVTRLEVGHRVRYDDGKLEAVVEEKRDGEVLLRVVKAKAGGAKLKAEKGVNLPDTALGLSPLTAKDESDLSTVIGIADMIGYSFVSRPDDLDLFEDALIRAGEPARPLALIAKIEQPEAVRNLPALIARARRPLGVMIARGDLAAEIGFERLAEMQEEILWICEAAATPVIWATQVLEDLVKDGVPSRGEMTDAAMAARAECVMLNKGPAVVEAVGLIDRLFTRMDDHVFKKTPTLRALTSW